jgi:hypothetical protein
MISPATPLSFWRWFFRGREGRAGWKKFTNGWLVVHAALGAALAYALPFSLERSAQTVLLPLAGVFVGMTFAWVGNAQAVLQSPELERVAANHPGGIENYVYTFQAAILTILVTLVAWGFAALGLFERPCGWGCPAWGYEAASATLYALASLAMRECWHVMLGAQMLFLMQGFVKRLPPPGAGGRATGAATPDQEAAPPRA